MQWSPRNAYRGDDLYTFDLRLSRTFYFREHMVLNLAFDGFNVFNRQNVNEVTSVYGGGTPDFCGGSTPFNGPSEHYGDRPPGRAGQLHQPRHGHVQPG